MKQLLTIIALFTIVAMGAQTTIKYPSGASTGYTMAASGTVAVTFTNTMSHPSSVPTLTGNITLSVTAGRGLVQGSTLLVVVKTTATETTTFTGDIVAPVVTGVAGKTWSQAFIYNGSKYYPAGAKIQVD